MGLIPSKKGINLHGQVKPISIPCSEAKWSRGSSESACVLGGALIVCDVRNARGQYVSSSSLSHYMTSLVCKGSLYHVSSSSLSHYMTGLVCKGSIYHCEKM